MRGRFVFVMLAVAAVWCRSVPVARYRAHLTILLLFVYVRTASPR